MRRSTTRVIFHVHRLIKKHVMTATDFCNYFKRSINLVRYLSRDHFVVNRKLIRRGTRRFLKYNTIQKKLCPPKKKRKEKNIQLTWAKLVASYQRKLFAAGKFECQVTNNDVVPARDKLLMPDDIKKLKARLEQYKNNNRNKKIAEVESNELKLNSVEINRGVSPDFLKPITIDDPLMHDQNLLESSLKCFQNNTQTDTKVDSGKEMLKGSKFLDSLINKLKSNSDVVYNKEKVHKPKQTTIVSEISNQKTDMTAPVATYDDDSSNSSDFLGFNETDTVGLLPTPVVPRQLKNNQSAFISERLDTFLRENSLENSAQVEIPKHRNFEEGMVCEGAKPPKILMPKVPNGFSKARTVAEKRILFEKKRSVKYYMIENENTIYRELKKRAKYGVNNIYIIQQMQNVDVPFTRDCWKASTWLHTLNGRFYFRIVNIDGLNYKIIGGRGNHVRKYIGMQCSYPVKKRTKIGCPSNCTQHLALNNVKLRQPKVRSPDKTKEAQPLQTKKEVPKLLLAPAGWIANDLPAYKPRPLSKKCKNTWANKIDVGDLQVYNLPAMQLEVFPKVNQPLDELLKPYLKMILPSKSISREWAEFSVSTLVTKNLSNPLSSIEKSYVFDIPYVNNQKTMLVRKIVKRRENYDHEDLTVELKFRKKINSRNSLSVTCGDILTEMIDSVALGLSEESFIKNDPDIDYVRNCIKEKDTNRMELEEVAKTNKAPRSDQRRKLLMELKRLNATIVDAKNNYGADAVQCKNESCRLGCICHSIATPAIRKSHCEEVECMFECTCRGNVSLDNDTLNKALSTEDAILIREKVTAKLAKVEKEFCATVVLTDNQTYLINDSQSDKRRMKRVPKRFGDFVNDNVKATNLINDVKEPPQTLPKPCQNENINVSTKSIKHCNVILRNLMNMEDIEPWCMIHCLYKCFCRGKATEGDSFEIKKQEPVVEEDVVYARKRRYSFDKDEDNMAMHKAAKRKYYALAYNHCSRVNEIPSHVYHTLNRQKLNSVRTKAKSEENEKTEELLTRRIMKSAHYINRVPSAIKQMSVMKPSSSVKQTPVEKLNSHAKQMEKPKLVLNRNQIPNSLQFSSTLGKLPHLKKSIRKEDHIISFPNFQLDAISSNKEGIFSLSNEMLFKSAEKKKNRKSTDLVYDAKSMKLNTISSAKEKEPQPILAEPVVDISRFEQEFESIIAERTASTDPSVTSPIRNNLQNDMPVITSVRSLNSTSDGGNPSSENQKNVPKIKIMNGKISTDSFHTTAIAKLNLAVTKTMQSICNIQKKNSKEIPVPAPKTLSSLQWRFFVQAFNEDLVFVWEVCVDGKQVIAATNNNIMPRVPGAMSVSNIKALMPNNLPLLGKMLLDKVASETTKTLSVLMTGHEDYWHIIGFINSKQDYLTKRCIIKPTPESHPQVSAKVNSLYKLLIVREMKNIAVQASKQQTKQLAISNVSIPIAQTTIVDNKDNEGVAVQSAKPNGIPDDQMPPSNVEIKTMTPVDLDSMITIPIPIKEDHRWLMLSTVDDFSHIYIPAWKNFLTHDRIKKSVLIASCNKKTVRLGKLSSNTDIYATPDSWYRIYFGPFQEETKVGLILYQNVDGKMMLREDFEKSQNIKRDKRTVAYWIRIKNSELMYDIKANSTPEVTRLEPENPDPEEDECIIIEDALNDFPRPDIVIKQEPLPVTVISYTPDISLQSKTKPESILKRNQRACPPYIKPKSVPGIASSPYIKPNTAARNLTPQNSQYSKQHAAPDISGLNSPYIIEKNAPRLKVLGRRHSMMAPQSSAKMVHENPVAVRQSMPLTLATSSTLLKPSAVTSHKNQIPVGQSFPSTLATSSLLPLANPILLNQLQAPIRVQPDTGMFTKLPSSLVITPDTKFSGNSKSIGGVHETKIVETDVSLVRLKSAQNSSKCSGGPINNIFASNNNIFIRPASGSINTAVRTNSIINRRLSTSAYLTTGPTNTIAPTNKITSRRPSTSTNPTTGSTNIVTSENNIMNWPKSAKNTTGPINTVASTSNITNRRQSTSTNPTTGPTNVVASTNTNIINMPCTNLTTEKNPNPTTGPINTVTSTSKITNRRPSTSTNPTTGSINTVAFTHNIMNRPSTNPTTVKNQNPTSRPINAVSSTNNIMNRPSTNVNPTTAKNAPVKNDSLLKVRAALIPQRRLSVPCRITSQLGYIISNVFSLGKVPAEKTLNGYILKLPDLIDSVRFSNIQLVDKYLTDLVKRTLQVPCFQSTFNWRFVPNGLEEQRYRLMCGNICSQERRSAGPTGHESSTSTTSSFNNSNRTVSSYVTVDNLTDLKNSKNNPKVKNNLAVRKPSHQLPVMPNVVQQFKKQTSSVSDVILIDD